MGRTVRLCVAISMTVICLAVLEVTVVAKKKKKPRRQKANAARVVLPNPVIFAPPSISTGNLENVVQTMKGASVSVANAVKGPKAVASPVQAGQVIISELRLRGQAGAEDEFVELYNNTDAPLTVQALDASSGWTIAISDGQITGPLFTVPNGTIIPARGHLLGANTNGYSLCNYPSGNGTFVVTAPATKVASPCLTNGFGGTFTHTTPDRTWDFDVSDGMGVALFATTDGTNFTAATRLDAAGFANSPALYKEGAGIGTAVTANLEHTYYRDLRTGTPRDTGDNAADFLLVGTAPGIQVSRLGAPGPENLASPIVNNSTIAAALLDRTQPASSEPNRTRSSTPEVNADFGTMILRQRFTNNTGQPITRLRFRIVNITTLGTPGSECPGGSCADLRALTSQDHTKGGVLDAATCSAEPGSPAPPCIVTVRGVVLEQPPDQPAGGAYNSSLSANFITLGTPLLPGQSVNIAFKLGVMRTGSFRFFVNIEALNSTTVLIP